MAIQPINSSSNFIQAFQQNQTAKQNSSGKEGNIKKTSRYDSLEISLEGLNKLSKLKNKFNSNTSSLKKAINNINSKAGNVNLGEGESFVADGRTVYDTGSGKSGTYGTFSIGKSFSLNVPKGKKSNTYSSPIDFSLSDDDDD
ncbi:MAG: hypothetical protein KAI43_03100 [Candidatus Aureabacteria bacterium]|nr:hypothetical protein [Candidatus Auribacterota bacterium]